MMSKISRKKVLNVTYWHSIYNCYVITYQKEPNLEAFAAVPDNFSVNIGDTVWVFTDDRLVYSGFNAMVVPINI